MTKIVAVTNEKGGVGKTVTSVNLSIGSAMKGKKVLVVDFDPLANLTVSMGWLDKNRISTTIATHLERVLSDEQSDDPKEGILRHNEGVDVLPANRKLSGIEMALVGTPIDREIVVKTYLTTLKESYDYMIIDCPANLNNLTINALVAADVAIMPTQAQFLSANALTDLMGLVSKIQKKLNPHLRIGGILLTMVDKRTTLARVTAETLRNEYVGIVKLYASQIPMAVKAAEISTTGQSIYAYDDKCAAAKAYGLFVKEVLADEEGD